MGILALATAPATTVLVLKETESEGPVTDYTNALVALNNLVSIVLFELLFLAIRFVHEQWGGSTAVSTGQLLVEIGELTRDVAGSVVLGMAGGLIVSYAFGLVESGRRLVVLGTVVVFEIIGPILIRFAVLRAGEVPLAHAIRHPTPGLVDQLRSIWNRWLMAVGRNPWKNRSPDDLTVKELMRTNVEGIPQAASFDVVVAAIEHSRDHTYPVVGDQRELVGVIRYRELSTVLFDPAVGLLVRAADVATAARRFLRPDDSLVKAFKMFKTSKDDCIPVVTPDEPHQLLGILRRRDVLRLLIREQLDSI